MFENWLQGEKGGLKTGYRKTIGVSKVVTEEKEGSHKYKSEYLRYSHYNKLAAWYTSVITNF